MSVQIWERLQKLSHDEEGDVHHRLQEKELGTGFHNALLTLLTVPVVLSAYRFYLYLRVR